MALPTMQIPDRSEEALDEYHVHENRELDRKRAAIYRGAAVVFLLILSGMLIYAVLLA